MRRTKLKLVGQSTTTQDKQEIQDLVRLICCYRDGGCVLHRLRHCGGVAKVITTFQIIDANQSHIVKREIISNNVIQADHLITRSNSATFADTRLIVCLCKNCHAWKNWNKEAYDKLVRLTLSSERKRLWDACEEQRHAHKTKKMDWKLEILALQKELQFYEH